jgi:hypothetical protein
VAYSPPSLTDSPSLDSVLEGGVKWKWGHDSDRAHLSPAAKDRQHGNSSKNCQKISHASFLRNYGIVRSQTTAASRPPPDGPSTPLGNYSRASFVNRLSVPVLFTNTLQEFSLSDSAARQRNHPFLPIAQWEKTLIHCVEKPPSSNATWRIRWEDTNRCVVNRSSGATVIAA